MKTKFFQLAAVLIFIVNVSSARASQDTQETLVINDQEYLEMTGLNVMLAHDFYPEGHQGGVGIILNGQRIGTNGDLRLDPTPGQWQPIPAVGTRVVNRDANEISVRMSYPDEKIDRKGFNPIAYPDLKLKYTLRIKPDGKAFRILVDLDEPLPPKWVGKVGFNFELFPGILFGKSFAIGDTVGVFPRQANGPGQVSDDDYEVAPLGIGRKVTIAPESERQRTTFEAVNGGDIQLLDGRAKHNNGWFVLRSLVKAGATKGAIEWLVTPHAIPGWLYEPVIQVSQVGYHPKQPKIATIELDRNDKDIKSIVLYRLTENGPEIVQESKGRDWGRFLRYHYLQYNFSGIETPGLYQIGYGEIRSNVFQISSSVFERNVWQPTVEYFLPVQMAHMRVNDKYRVWHGLSHIDDALMAPINHNHFDGYEQGPSTLTKFKPGEHVPGLDRGGWYDAGDHDLRIESQIDTVHGLALAWELFHPDLDNTTVDQTLRIVEIHQPDGKPDVLQQIEHGVLSVVGGYNSLGRLYRGIQDASLHQYTFLGDAADMTDNEVYHDHGEGAMSILAKAAEAGDQREPRIGNLNPLGSKGSADDRWVFTEENPRRELDTAGGLAAAYRALKGYNDTLANECLRIAKELYSNAKLPGNAISRLEPALELYISTGDPAYKQAVLSFQSDIVAHVDRIGWIGARAMTVLGDDTFNQVIRASLKDYRKKVDAEGALTPYGIPYKPAIWGAGWDVERFGVEQYFLHKSAPDIFDATYMLDALNFILGCHPGSNTASFVSGVGSKSMIPAYGMNRADWSYIPGGITSGTALIRPDFPELLEWPFLWQQGEYCLGYSTSDYVFLVLAANDVLNKETVPANL